MLPLPLAQFNSLLRDYMRSYNTTFHRGINDTPMNRFLAASGATKTPLSSEWLDECFLNRTMRKVRKDSTISIDKICYDVPMQFTSSKVEVRYLPDDKDSAFILDNEMRFPIRRTDRNDNCHTKRSNTAIDEAQYLSTGILNDIKMLMNYGYDSVNYFTLILCGESHLNDTLRRPVHEALRQRITVHYNYSGLSDEEVAQYVLHKIRLAGASESIISQTALAAVHSSSQGNSRLIDNLMTDTLTIGAQTKATTIDTDVIQAAIENRGLF